MSKLNFYFELSKDLKELEALPIDLSLPVVSDIVVVYSKENETDKTIGAAWGRVSGDMGLFHGIWVDDASRNQHVGFSVGYQLLRYMKSEKVKYMYGSINEGELATPLTRLFKDLGCQVLSTACSVEGNLDTLMEKMEGYYESRNGRE